VLYSSYGVVQQHARAGKAHHLADLRTHGWLVAMHGAFGTSGFIGQEGKL